MFGYSGIVAVIFRFINSGILFVFGWYIYKRYVRSSLEEQLDEQQGYITGLSQQKNALRSKIVQLGHELEAQEESCVILKQKIVDWHTAVSAKLDKRSQERTHIEKKVQEILNKQNDFLTQSKLLQEAIEPGLKKAQEKLEDIFGQENKNTEFVTVIINQLDAKE